MDIEATRNMAIDDDDGFCETFTPATRAHDGGHECYVIAPTVHRLHRLVKAGLVRLDHSIRRSKESKVEKQRRIDEWTKGLLSNQKPFLGQLTWNVRRDIGGMVEYIARTHTLKIAGFIYVPDSACRHEALVKAYDASERGRYFDPRYRIGIVVHHLSYAEEARLTDEMNQVARPGV